MASQQHIEDKIDILLSEHQDEKLKQYLDSLSYMHVAACINHFAHGKKKIFRLLSREKKQDVIWDLNHFSRRYIISSMPNSDIRDLLQQMDSDDASDIVHLLPNHRRKQLLKTLSKQDSEEIEEILTYAPTSAGHIMQKELVSVPEYFSVLDTIKRVQRMHKEVKNIVFIFVCSAGGVFLGVVPVEKLITTKPHIKLRTLIEETPVIHDLMDQEDAAHIFKQADLPVLPVVDKLGKLVGRITADDVVDILEEEQSEDMFQMAGVDKDEGVDDPPLLSARRRIPWLTINLATAILAAFVVSLFQGTIQRIVILAAYMPIVAGMGGNAATQTITVLVRALALKQVEHSHAWKIIIKEFIIGITNGLVLGLLVACISYIYNGQFMLGIVIGLAMIINLVIAGVTGTVIPLLLKTLRMDPALASSVFVTTCTDVGGFLSFLGLATILL